MKRTLMAVVACIGLMALTGCVEVQTVINSNPTCDVGKVPTWDYRFVLFDRADETIKYVEVNGSGNITQTYYSRDLSEIIDGELEEFTLEIGDRKFPFKSRFLTQIDSDEMLYVEGGKVIHWWDSDNGIKKAEVINVRKYLNAKLTGGVLPKPPKGVEVTYDAKTKEAFAKQQEEILHLKVEAERMKKDATLEAPVVDDRKITRKDLFDADFDTFFHTGQSFTGGE